MRTDFGSVKEGPVELVTLTKGRLTAEFITLGAAVRRLRVDDRDVVLGHPDAPTYADSMFALGQTIGRFANRIAHARFAVDDTWYVLPANENDNTLHGGALGFGRRLWTITELANDSVTLELESADGDQGFPGLLLVQVRYSLGTDELRIDYTATTTEPTTLNLTNHAYFNLAGEDSGPTDAQTLNVPAATVVEVDAESIPTGALVEVGEHDLRSPRPIGEVAPLDTCFVIDGTRLRPHATLATSDLALDVLSDAPGVQVFTADGMADVPGLSGAYGPRAGVALECQNFPDAPNQPSFPNSILRPGETYAQTTVWRFRSL